ncbi:MAG: hypothetical protein RL702_2588 [Pseudomonadota bacterium]
MGYEIIKGFADELQEASLGGHLELALAKATERLGFDHFALTLEIPSRAEAPPAILLHDYPDEWARVYISFDLAGRDPVRRACDKSMVGFSWHEIEALIPMTRGDRQMLAVGRECGIANGFTVPRFLPGAARGSCTFVVGPGQELPKRLLYAAETIGALALVGALKISKTSPVSRAVLSDRQRECLLWAARGKTAAETAIILGISMETVIQHLKTARERYDVHCRQSLILNALHDGLIGFGDIFGWRVRAGMSTH